MESEPQQVEVRVWDIPTRVFHWAVFVLLIVQLVTGYYGGEWMRWHFASGYVVLTLVVFRVIWGFVGSTHARFASFIAGPAATMRFARRLFSRQAVPQVGHNPLGGWNVIVLIVVLALQTVSGLFANDGAGNEGPLASLVSLDASTRLSEFHDWNLKALLVLSGLHVAAVLFHWLVKKENLVPSMFTGRKWVPAAAVRERRDAMRKSPRRRAASREHALAYFARPLRSVIVLAVSIVVVYIATRGWR
jgi:cytochrome b